MSGRRRPSARIDLGSADERKEHEGEAGAEYAQRHPAHARWRQERQAEHEDYAGSDEDELPLDEVVGGQAALDGDRRACGKRQHHAGAGDRQDRGEQHAIDREPPVGQHALLGAGKGHHIAPVILRGEGSKATKELAVEIG
jgi:hypothetical protein